MIYRAFWFVLLAAIALSDGARSGEGAESFEYSARLQSEIVAPILQRELGSDLVRYDDPANPRISRRCDEIWLVFQFDFSKLAKDELILDPPYVIIALDSQTLRVRGVNKRPSYVVGSPEPCGSGSRGR